SKVDAYCTNLHDIEDARWGELLEACEIHKQRLGPPGRCYDKNGADLLLLDNNRAFMFNFCSPVKA
ncbi:hypothetical protein BYT27DRAFT_7022969, partial [Phlegmacium glaucopus]